MDSAENRSLLCDRGDTRLSLHLSVVTLGCSDGRDERGKRQSHYLDRLCYVLTLPLLFLIPLHLFTCLPTRLPIPGCHCWLQVAVG